MNEKINRLKNKKLALNPYVFEKPSLSSISIKLLVLLFLQILCLFFTKSYSALNVIFISLIASVLSSVINVFFNSQRKISTMLVIVQGILIGMFIPENYPLFSVFTISFIILFSAIDPPKNQHKQQADKSTRCRQQNTSYKIGFNPIPQSTVYQH